MRSFVFDTETTALVANSLQKTEHQPRIVEFYGCVLDSERGNEIVDELEFYCDPGIPLPEETTKITGIKPEDLKGAKTFRHWWPDVKLIIEKCDEVVAHNLSYDRFVVDTEFTRLGIEPVRWPKQQTCTVESTEWMKGFRLSLSSLHENLFGEPFAGAHRARVDVAALVRCFRKLREDGEL